MTTAVTETPQNGSAAANGTDPQLIEEKIAETKITEEEAVVTPLKAEVDPAVILRPNDFPAVPAILSEIQTRGASAVSSPEDDGSRTALLESARALVRALEKPRETMIRHCWADMAAFSVLSLGVETGVWDYLARDDEPKQVADIAAALGMETAFLARLLKHVAAMGYIVEVGRDEYKPTNFVKALTIPIVGSGYPIFTGPGNTGGLARCVHALPQYAKQTGFVTPTSMADGNLQFAHGTKLNMFEWLMANPPSGEQFNFHMGGYAHGRPRWVDTGFYPVRERLLDGFDATPAADGTVPALLVDIGGGLGHDIEEFLHKTPKAKGRLVLEDLEPVIGQIKTLDERIERLVYDFHTEQPVKGSRAYYMHSVLHDWPDEVCLSILSNIKAAMVPGYSRLLINENVIPDTGASWEATALDVLMAALLSSRERTRVEWQKLLEEGAGFKITNIYTYANGVESLIECVLPESA